jgi:large conductance mechanosensitive channel
MLKDFREFAIRGNALDLAIGVIMGTAFGAVVSSLVNDLFMPPLGLLLGGADFSNFFLVLDGGSYATVKAAREAGAAPIAYGLFVNTIINLFVIALVLFMVVRALNRLRRPAPAPAPGPTTKECPHCTTSIPLRATRCPHCTSSL